VILLAAAVIGTACGDDSTESEEASEGQLLPFEQIQTSEFAFEADPTDPNRGIFRVETSEPAICAIVWGETEEFGNFNNSLAMNGTGIIHHDVVLPGTVPGRTYYFRVQGTTADGDQYRSGTGTFTIPALDASDSGTGSLVEVGENLALGAMVIEVSSVFGPGWEAENAVDGDTDTEWASRGDGDDGFIVIDLGETREIAGVEFLTRSMLDGTATTEMFTVTVDGGEPMGPFPAGNVASPNTVELELTGREIRLDVDTSTGGNVGAVEIRVFAPA
jgi:hypothetical protein